jgi:hypothetical protein
MTDRVFGGASKWLLIPSKPLYNNTSININNQSTTLPRGDIWNVAYYRRPVSEE